MPIINKPFVPPAPPPPTTTDMEETKFPNPIERYKFEPDGTVEHDLIWEQAQNRLFLGLKLVGEQVAWYRQKQTGELCSCVDPLRQSAVSTCPICRGTRFVGGYDYLGKGLVDFQQVAKTKVITELGMKMQEVNNPWTLNFPLLKERDFLVRKLYLPMSGALKIVDEPVVRGNYSTTQDILRYINVTNVWKIADTANATQADYTEGTDYILTGGELVLAESSATPVANQRTLRLLGKKPPIFWGGEQGQQPLNINAGLSAGMTLKVQNDLIQSGLMDATLSAGTGADAGYFVFTIAKTGVENTTTYPLESFIATITGDRIVWLATGKNPTIGNRYYISYDYIQTFTQRYQIKTYSPVAPQGAVVFQSFELNLLDPTHPIYNVGSIFDNGEMIDFHNGITKAMIKQMFGEAGLAPGNQGDKKFNQEAGYY